jgi:hypothetical protein
MFQRFNDVFEDEDEDEKNICPIWLKLNPWCKLKPHTHRKRFKLIYDNQCDR